MGQIGDGDMTKKQREQREAFLRRRDELLRTIGPPTHFTIEEVEAAIIKVRDKRLRREAEKRRSGVRQSRPSEGNEQETGEQEMTEKQLKRREDLEQRTKELLRTFGPPTHFTNEELDAAIIKARDKRLRREAEKRRSRRQ